MKPKLADQAKGKWPSILAAIGVSRDHLTGRHGPCPLCSPGGAGTDRFRFDNKDGRGSFYCSQCGSGDGIEFVKRFLGVEFKDAAREIEKHVGSAAPIAIRQGRSADEVKREMNDIWKGSRPIGENPATVLWWSARVGLLPDSTELRSSQSLFCPGHGSWPGMVARVRDAEGKPINLHRTYLTPEGHKAAIPEPRRVMDAPLPKGCAVRLQPAAETMGIAEGLETAISCWLMFAIPTWAALTAENLTGWNPPEGVKRVMIFGDNDASLTGHWASYALAKRLRCAKAFESVEVKIPEAEGDDWNDVFRRLLAGEQAPHLHAESAHRMTLSHPQVQAAE